MVEDEMTPSITGPLALEASDLAQAAALSAALSWPHRPEDWRFALDLGHGLALRRGEVLVGTAMAWCFGDRFATVGMIIVDASSQGLRLGSRLFDALLETLGTRNVLLNATREGLELYRRRGFVSFGQVCQHQGIAVTPPDETADAPVTPAEGADLPAVLDLDAAATGMPRQQLLARLVEAGDLHVLRSETGVPCGYAITRQFGRGHVIGPVVAVNEEDAKALIADTLSRLQGQFVRIDTSASSNLGPWLERSGLQHVDTVEAMCRGTLPEPTGPRRVFAIASQSLG